jgi:hypothetical protein
MLASKSVLPLAIASSAEQDLKVLYVARDKFARDTITL